MCVRSSGERKKRRLQVKRGKKEGENTSVVDHDEADTHSPDDDEQILLWSDGRPETEKLDHRTDSRFHACVCFSHEIVFISSHRLFSLSSFSLTPDSWLTAFSLLQTLLFPYILSFLTMTVFALTCGSRARTGRQLHEHLTLKQPPVPLLPALSFPVLWQIIPAFRAIFRQTGE